MLIGISLQNKNKDKKIVILILIKLSSNFQIKDLQIYLFKLYKYVLQEITNQS